VPCESSITEQHPRFSLSVISAGAFSGELFLDKESAYPIIKALDNTA
jgi:hypothetical protein